MPYIFRRRAVIDDAGISRSSLSAGQLARAGRVGIACRNARIAWRFTFISRCCRDMRISRPLFSAAGRASWQPTLFTFYDDKSLSLRRLIYFKASCHFSPLGAAPHFLSAARDAFIAPDAALRRLNGFLYCYHSPQPRRLAASAPSFPTAAAYAAKHLIFANENNMQKERFSLLWAPETKCRLFRVMLYHLRSGVSVVWVSYMHYRSVTHRRFKLQDSYTPTAVTSIYYRRARGNFVVYDYQRYAAAWSPASRLVIAHTPPPAHVITMSSHRQPFIYIIVDRYHYFD